jgi:hypothetical protein
MRRIISEQEKEKKRQRNTFVVSMILLAILVFSTIGYGFLAKTENNVQGNDNTDGKGVRNVGDRWVLTSNGQELYFSNSPESVQNISVPLFLTWNDFSGVPLYISSDNEAIKTEVAYTLGRFASRVQEACYGPCEKDLPEKDCTENLIVWRDSLESKIYQEKKCVFIEGDLRTVDAFLYKMFGI